MIFGSACTLTGGEGEKDSKKTKCITTETNFDSQMETETPGEKDITGTNTHTHTLSLKNTPDKPIYLTMLDNEENQHDALETEKETDSHDGSEKRTNEEV